LSAGVASASSPVSAENVCDTVCSFPVFKDCIGNRDQLLSLDQLKVLLPEDVQASRLSLLLKFQEIFMIDKRSYFQRNKNGIWMIPTRRVAPVRIYHPDIFYIIFSGDVSYLALY
jgi:hypothetical protein